MARKLNWNYKRIEANRRVIVDGDDRIERTHYQGYWGAYSYNFVVSTPHVSVFQSIKQKLSSIFGLRKH